MRCGSNSNRLGVRLLLMAGAFGLGLECWVVHAQAPAPPAKGTTPVGDHAAGQPATSTPQSRLRAQRWATRKAKAVFEIAKATRELAEIAVEEYAQRSYLQDLATVAGEVKLAASDLERSHDQFEWAKRMFDKHLVTMATKVSAELIVKKAQFALEQRRASWRC